MESFAPRLALDPVGHWVIVALSAVVMLGLLFIGPAVRLSRRQRLVLLALRFFVIALTLLVMLRPTLVYRGLRPQQATVILGIDLSRSMLASGDELPATEADRKSRWDILRETLEASSADLAALARQLEIKVYGFDGQLRPLKFQEGKIELPERPEGDQTAIGWALSELPAKEQGKRLVAVVLLTDGNQQALPPLDRDPQSAARQYKDFDCPIHTVTFGRSEHQSQPRDLALLSLLVNRTVFEKQELPIKAEARFSGFVNKRVPVELLFETSPGKLEVVQTTHLQATRDGQLLPLDLTYVPEKTGEYKLALRIARQPGELVESNNELSTFVNVRKGGVRVLYLEDRLRVEQKYVRRALDAAQDINVDYLRLDARNAAQRPEAITRALENALQKGKYDVFVLGDVDATAFRPAELQGLAALVKDGAGLIMLGGKQSFGPGGYAETPLADLLPVRMDKQDRQPLDEPVRTDHHLPGPITLRPGRLAGLHFITRLGPPDKNDAAWQALPPLDGANKFRGLKDATVLLESTDGAPILAAGNTPGGRVLAFAGDTTWRWWMHGHETEFKRFWRQVILWLAFKDQEQAGNVWVTVEPRHVRKGEKIEIMAGANSSQGDPLPDAQFAAEIVFPVEKPADGRAPAPPQRQRITLVRKGDQHAFTFKETAQVGDYRVLVRAMHKGAEIGLAEARFAVTSQDLELERPSADFLAMKRLSEATPGGIAVTPERCGELWEALKELPRQLAVPVETKSTLWDRWEIYLLFALGVSVEWFLRKRWGLV